MLPPGLGSGRLLVRRDRFDSGEVKTVADLKGRRIAVNNIQSASLNYVMRGIAKGNLGKDDVKLVEMPFNQFVPAFEKKAIDAAMVYALLIELLTAKLQTARPLPEADMTPICRVVNKYASSMPPDCGGYIFNSVDPNGGVSIESLERYQREWLAWGVMKEAADIRSHVNLEFSKHAVSVLGPFK